ncbi:MAG: MATE family efflux transporter [Eubacterium sp.]|nr:MATE family efflux transporter [Eubacterium sp.]
MHKQQSANDLTIGNPLTKILLFSLPLVFGTLFQQLYNFVDTIIIGRCLGESALAAVGVTYSLNFLILGFVQGCAVGFGVPVSQSFGAKDQDDVHRYYWNGLWLSAAISIIFTIATILMTVPLLRLIHTPAEILDMAADYIKIIFLGLPLSMLYNHSASVLRALGDSRHPFYFLLISCVLNIILDYLLVAVIPCGVAGAAAATILSQGVSGLLNCWWLFAKTDGFSARKKDLAFSAAHAKRLCVIGLPMGFEYSVSAIGAVVVQNAINALGSVAIAAQTTGEKIRQMFTLPMESVGMAMATYTAQNYGAKKYDRIKSGIKSSLLIQYVYCLVSWLAIFCTKTGLVSLVLGESSSPTAVKALEYLTRISVLFAIHGSLMIFRNTLQGMGYSFQAILSGIGELIGRSSGAALAFTSLGFTAICYANPISWLLALCYCVIMVFVYLRKCKDLHEND